MTGTAVVTFTCGAEYPRTLQDWAMSGQPKIVNFPCDEIAVLDLVNDGQYANFTAPQGWHIELGVDDPTKTIVRCSKHCTWIKPRPMNMGHWEDAP